MWINPNHPNPPRPAAPPMDNGRRLAVLPRGNGAELRLSLAEWEGRPYVSLRVWEPDEHGRLWPAKGKGCSIRIREIADIIAGLRQVEGMVDDHGQGSDGGKPGQQQPVDDRPRYVERRRRPQVQEFDPASLGDTSIAPTSGEFDEFGNN